MEQDYQATAHKTDLFELEWYLGRVLFHLPPWKRQYEGRKPYICQYLSKGGILGWYAPKTKDGTFEELAERLVSRHAIEWVTKENWYKGFELAKGVNKDELIPIRRPNHYDLYEPEPSPKYDIDSIELTGIAALWISYELTSLWLEYIFEAKKHWPRNQWGERKDDSLMPFLNKVSSAKLGSYVYPPELEAMGIIEGSGKYTGDSKVTYPMKQLAQRYLEQCKNQQQAKAVEVKELPKPRVTHKEIAAGIQKILKDTGGPVNNPTEVIDTYWDYLTCPKHTSKGALKEAWTSREKLDYMTHNHRPEVLAWLKQQMAKVAKNYT